MDDDSPWYLTGAPEAGCQVFWGAGDELGQALPLLPFLDGLRVREPSANPRRSTIVRLLRGEVATDRGTDVPAVLAEQLLALVAEQVANRALEHAAEPDLLVDLHWTLAQCRMRAGESAESLATLDRALASPGISARHRARLLVLAARTHFNLGAVEEAGRVAASALAAASEAGDAWATGWALFMMALVTSVRGRMPDALPLFDRALAVTQADPALRGRTLPVSQPYAPSRRVDRGAGTAGCSVGTVRRRGDVHDSPSPRLNPKGRIRRPREDRVGTRA